MLRDAMIFGGGVFVGWLSLAGVTWLLIYLDDRKRENEDC